jgi:hypothetical protein
VGDSPSIGRAASAEDVPAVASCLTSAFFEDPLWGPWTFPDPGTRSERLYRLMGFWALAAVRYPWVRMTAGAEAVAVWIPPGKPEMTAEEEARFAALVDELPRTQGGRAARAVRSLRRAPSHRAELLPEPLGHAPRPRRARDRDSADQRGPRAHRRRGRDGLPGVDQPRQHRALRSARLPPDRGFRARRGPRGHDDVARGPRLGRLARPPRASRRNAGD